MPELSGKRSGSADDPIRSRGLELVHGERRRMGGAGRNYGAGVRAVEAPGSGAGVVD